MDEIRSRNTRTRGRYKYVKTFSKNVVFFLLGDSPASEVYVSNKSKNKQLKS